VREQGVAVECCRGLRGVLKWACKMVAGGVPAGCRFVSNRCQIVSNRAAAYCNNASDEIEIART